MKHISILLFLSLLFLSLLFFSINCLSNEYSFENKNVKIIGTCQKEFLDSNEEIVFNNTKAKVISFIETKNSIKDSFKIVYSKNKVAYCFVEKMARIETTK